MKKALTIALSLFMLVALGITNISADGETTFDYTANNYEYDGSEKELFTNVSVNNKQNINDHVFYSISASSTVAPSLTEYSKWTQAIPLVTEPGTYYLYAVVGDGEDCGGASNVAVEHGDNHCYLKSITNNNNPKKAATISLPSSTSKPASTSTVEDAPVRSYDVKDKNQDGVVTCDEEMNSKDWIWSDTKKTCVYKATNTSTK